MKEFNITAQEVSIDTHGLSFLCVFGTHINGGWCAILNFGVSCELATNSDSTVSNAAEIAHALACCCVALGSIRWSYRPTHHG